MATYRNRISATAETISILRRNKGVITKAQIRKRLMESQKRDSQTKKTIA